MHPRTPPVWCTGKYGQEAIRRSEDSFIIILPLILSYRDKKLIEISRWSNLRPAVCADFFTNRRLQSEKKKSWTVMEKINSSILWDGQWKHSVFIPSHYSHFWVWLMESGWQLYLKTKLSCETSLSHQISK